MTAKLFAIVIFNAVIAASLLTLILKSLDHDLPSGVEGGLIGGVIGAITAVTMGGCQSQKEGFGAPRR